MNQKVARQLRKIVGGVEIVKTYAYKNQKGKAIPCAWPMLWEYNLGVIPTAFCTSPNHIKYKQLKRAYNLNGTQFDPKLNLRNDKK